MQNPDKTKAEHELTKTLKHLETDAPERLKEDAMLNGQTKPAYNVQIATHGQYVTNYGIFQRPADQGPLIPFMQSYKARYDTYGKSASAAPSRNAFF